MSKINLFSGRAPASVGAAYTATVDTTIDAASVCNTTGAGVTLSAWLAPDGAASGDANKVYDALTIPGNSQVQLALLINQAVPRGGKVYLAASSGTALTVTIAGRT